MNRTATVFTLMLAAVAGGVSTGCSTAPKSEDRASVASRSQSTTMWFKSKVNGLTAQIRNSAGYIVLPDVGQWGVLVGGGTFGRGVLCKPDGTQIGWAAINSGSVGLQAGVQGFRMLIVIETQDELRNFMAGKWNGQAGAVAVLGEEGGSAASPFQNGIAVYQGANSGLMAGVSVGLNRIRYESLSN